MPISLLNISDFRNISQASLIPSSSLNFFYGLNGSGKTSILECISVLSLGRSFRSRKHNNLVRFGTSNFCLFGEVIRPSSNETVSIGVERGNTFRASKTHINGSAALSSASLAEALAVQWIDSDTFLLLTGGPSERRAYLDWTVFHVKHSFGSLWKDYQSCLKQRNTMLKHGNMADYSLEYWDTQLASLGEDITASRSEIVTGLCDYLKESAKELEFIESTEELTFNFDQGWQSGLGLYDCLRHKVDNDLRLGFTSVGPHKAELKILYKGKPVSEVFSRGQQKALICCMKFSQIAYVQQVSHKPITLLVDDLTSELDENIQNLVARWIRGLEVQCFITGITLADLVNSWSIEEQNKAKVFHVKHGEVTEENLNGEVNDR